MIGYCHICKCKIDVAKGLNLKFDFIKIEVHLDCFVKFMDNVTNYVSEINNFTNRFDKLEMKIKELEDKLNLKDKPKNAKNNR